MQVPVLEDVLFTANLEFRLGFVYLQASVTIVIVIYGHRSPCVYQGSNYMHRTTLLSHAFY